VEPTNEEDEDEDGNISRHVKTVEKKNYDKTKFVRPE